MLEYGFFRYFNADERELLLLLSVFSILKLFSNFYVCFGMAERTWAVTFIQQRMAVIYCGPFSEQSKIK